MEINSPTPPLDLVNDWMTHWYMEWLAQFRKEYEEKIND